MKKLFLSVVTGSLLLMSSLHAQVMTYTGSDEYIMSEFETIDIAKQRAEQKAIRNAQEQAGVYVESNTEVVNMMVTKDEIRTLTAGILKVTDVQYQLTPLEGGKSLIVKATVKADIDSNELANYLNRPLTERADLVAQNLELQKAIAAQDAQIAQLKRQLADKSQDTTNIADRFAAEDKIFLSNQQLTEAGKLYYQGNLNGAANHCTRAIELSSNNATAYSIRGAIYYKLNDFNSALADFNKAIEFNHSDYKNFYNRGLAYIKLNDYWRAAQDFSQAIQLNPNDADSWHNRGLCRQRLGDIYGAQEDLRKARTLS
ncbi:MAG: tetratricopeptide repeat protein [Selenomonadaceae bacterium]|nr:tetratricopeptide repeat protein [Selenomonadaceae bacterium]